MPARCSSKPNTAVAYNFLIIDWKEGVQGIANGRLGVGQTQAREGFDTSACVKSAVPFYSSYCPSNRRVAHAAMIAYPISLLRMSK